MTRLTMNFDAVAAAAPLNREASAVRDGSGDLWEARVPAHIKHWSAPPPQERPPPPDIADLTGLVRNRLTVVRYHGPAKDGGRWLVRCACGNYELRRAKAIRKGGDEEMACFVCVKVETLRRRGSGKNTRATRRAEEARLDALAEQGRAPK